MLGSPNECLIRLPDHSNGEGASRNGLGTGWLFFFLLSAPFRYRALASGCLRVLKLIADGNLMIAAPFSLTTMASDDVEKKLPATGSASSVSEHNNNGYYEEDLREPPPESSLHRSLKARQISMIAV